MVAEGEAHLRHPPVKLLSGPPVVLFPKPYRQPQQFLGPFSQVSGTALLAGQHLAECPLQVGQTLLLLHSAEGLVFVAATPVGPHHPLVVPGDDFLHFLVPVSEAHLVDGRLVGVKGHQVSLLSTHLPASIVSVDRRSIPDPSPQLLVLLAYLASGPAQGILSDGPLSQLQPS